MIRTCAVCKQKIGSGETFAIINESTFYHTNGFCDTIVVEKLIDGNGDPTQINESLNDLSDYEIV